MLRRPVGGTTVSRAPEGCVGPGRPNGVGLVSLIHKLDGLTLRWTPTHTHYNACTTHPGSLVVGPATQAHPTRPPAATRHTRSSKHNGKPV